MKDVRTILTLASFLSVLQLPANAQLLQLLPSTAVGQNDFCGGFYTEFTPLGNISYELGNVNMRNRLQLFGLTNSDRLVLDNYVYSVGYWRNKWLFQLDYFTRNFIGSPGARNEELGANQYFFNSIQNQAIQLNVGYCIAGFKREDLYLKLAYGQHWNAIGLGITGSNAPVDLNGLSSGPVYIGLPPLRQTSPHLDFSLELRTKLKRRMEVLNAISFGCRYGLRETPWQAINYQTINAISDRSVVVYTKLSFGLRLNKEK